MVATVSLIKIEFCNAIFEYLGHIFHRGNVRPVFVNVDVIVNLPAPQSKKELVSKILSKLFHYCHPIDLSLE